MAIQQYPNRAAALADFVLSQLDSWSDFKKHSLVVQEIA